MPPCSASRRWRQARTSTHARACTRSHARKPTWLETLWLSALSCVGAPLRLFEPMSTVRRCQRSSDASRNGPSAADTDWNEGGGRRSCRCAHHTWDRRFQPACGASRGVQIDFLGPFRCQVQSLNDPVWSVGMDSFGPFLCHRAHHVPQSPSCAIGPIMCHRALHVP